MPFLRDDEYFLLMDNAFYCQPDPQSYDALPARYKHISEDGLKKLFDAGIQTTMPFQCVWNEIETSPGKYDWSYFDDYISRAYRVGMKVIIFNATHGYPQWFPDDYFVKDEQGKVHKETLSPWNKYAMLENERFTKAIQAQYSSVDCLVASAQLRVGETVLLNEPAFYDDYAIKSFQKHANTDRIPNRNDPETNEWLKKSYIGMLVRQQTICANNPNKEIFIMLHPAIADFGLYGNGCNWIEDILAALKNSINGVKINHIYYTWIQWSNYWEKMNKWRDAFEENLFGGAEYAEGLPHTTPKAIANKHRGQIISPCYPGIHNDDVEPWMVENIKKAQQMWENHSK